MFDLTAVFFLVSLAVIAFIAEEMLGKMGKKEWVKMVNLGLAIVGLVFLLNMLREFMQLLRLFANW
ncbi:MAG TPA: hypothetical protein GX504_02050 [Clostridia bacterium]|nr:hypothetical protein [Clostridia bacterium]